MLYALKYIFELLTLICALGFIISAIETVRTDAGLEDHSGAADWSDILVWVFGDIAALVGFLMFLLIWWALAHFCHLPFWG